MKGRVKEKRELKKGEKRREAEDSKKKRMRIREGERTDLHRTCVERSHSSRHPGRGKRLR